MDLCTVETYLQPTNLDDVQDWRADWAWLAGGTWMFTQPQPQVKTLVDMQHLGWSEIECTPDGLTIGATCILSHLLQATYPPEWSAVAALHSAVHELASFKVQNVATIGGNVCLALPAGTFAPALVALGATYHLIAPNGATRDVPALAFQTGDRQTVLQPGEALRQIWIPAENLTWHVGYRRICVATAGLAVTIVVVAYNPRTRATRIAIGAATPAPQVLSFPDMPSPMAMAAALDAQCPLTAYLDNEQASAIYRRHVTLVMMQRACHDALSANL